MFNTSNNVTRKGKNKPETSLQNRSTADYIVHCLGLVQTVLSHNIQTYITKVQTQKYFSIAVSLREYNSSLFMYNTITFVAQRPEVHSKKYNPKLFYNSRFLQEFINFCFLTASFTNASHAFQFVSHKTSNFHS